MHCLCESKIGIPHLVGHNLAMHLFIYLANSGASNGVDAEIIEKKKKKQIELEDAHTGLDKCERQIKHHIAGETQLTICIKKSKNLYI